jgi:sec-independent protein translocase protein TatB
MGEILGIGLEELIFIGILLALLFGPESIPRVARSAGRLLNRIFRSPWYRESQQIRKQIQDLPSALARLAELEEVQKNLNNEIADLKKSIEPGLADIALPQNPVVSPTTSPPAPAADPDRAIAPPDAPRPPDHDARPDDAHK